MKTELTFQVQNMLGALRLIVENTLDIEQDLAMTTDQRQLFNEFQMGLLSARKAAIALLKD